VKIRRGLGKISAIAGVGALAAGMLGVLGVSASPAFAASLDCSGQLSSSNNLCVDGSGGVLTVTPSGSLDTSPLVIKGVANDFLGTLSPNGDTSFPASQANWVSGLSGTLAGITAKITISNDGTATGTYSPSNNQVALSGNLTIALQAVSGPCSYTQPFNVNGTLSALSKSGANYVATGTVTQPTIPVAINSGVATGSGCGIAKSVLTGATQTLTLPVTIYTTVDPSSISPSSTTPSSTTPSSTTPSSTTPSSTTPSSTTPSSTVPSSTQTSTGSAASTVPSANTGEPWSGWTWWAAVGAAALAGLGLLFLALRRRGVHQHA